MNGKKTKIALSLLMVTTAMLSACSNSTEQSTTSSSPTAGATSTAKPAAPVDLTVEIFDRANAPEGGGSVTDNYLTKWIKETVKADLNINLSYYAVPRAQEVDKLNVLMSTNSAPDIIFTYYKDVYLNYAKQGGIYDLTALMEQYGADYKKLAGDRIKAGQVEGKQMALVSVLGNSALWGSFIRKDWLDKLSLPMPTTRDEWYKALKAFKEKDPGGVGKDLVAFGMYPTNNTNMDNHYGASSLLWSFVKSNTSERDLQTLPYFMLPGWKDGVRFVNQMFLDGLIDPEFSIDQNNTKLKANLASGKLGSVSQNFNFPYAASNGALNDTLGKNVAGAQMVPVDPFKNDAGKYPKVGNPLYGMYIMVPKSSKNPEAAVKYLNWLANQDHAKMIALGKENEHFKQVDGLNQAIDAKKNGLELWGSGDLNLIGWQQPLETIQKTALANPTLGNSGKLYVESMNMALKDSIIDYTRSPIFDRVIEANQKYKANLDKIYLDGLVRSILSKSGEFDKAYDAMAAEYLKNGGQDTITEKQAAYDAMNKK
ncbi:extracellular solute-binding protein [Paenibacillus koleovorans]|uniref:extracellular solute-binding protein n=1 Tax=Paenibacillus koleovorans TaxID=121608 RepID=UPI000FD73890|nr:extracellular solute-binding protein [Paenibacillus koleovorans]